MTVNWRTLGDIDLGIWTRTLYEAGSPLRAVAADAYKAASPHTALALAMLRVESFFGVKFNQNSKEANNYLNLRPPVGGGYMQYDDPVEGIRAWRERITDPTYKDGVYAKTITIADLVSVYAPDTDGNNEAAYTASIAIDLVRWGITPQEVTPSMATITAEPCSYEIAVVWSGDNRPGLPMNSPSKIVTHEVGNKSPGADEDMHRRFVHNGGGQYKVSFHFVVGPTKIIQLLYLDENAWHASDGYTGDGNRDAWGIEHIQIGDFSKTLQHSAWLQAELVRNPRRFAIKNPAAFVPDITRANVRDRMVRHYDEAPDKKYCPEMIMNRGLWEPLKDAVVAELDKTTPKPDPKPERKPYPITWEAGDVGPQKLNNYPALAYLFELTAKKSATRRCGASSDSPTFGEKLVPGKKYITIGGVDVPTASGRLQPWVILDDLARVPMSMFDEKLPRP